MLKKQARVLAATSVVVLVGLTARLYCGPSSSTSFAGYKVNWKGHSLHEILLSNPAPPPSADRTCSKTWQMLEYEATDLTPTVEYSRRSIRVRPSEDSERLSITKVDAALLSQTYSVDARKCQSETIPYAAMDLEVPVSPKPQTVDASHMIFGASTSLGRMGDSLPQWERWLAGSGARLIVLVSKSTEEERAAVEDEMNRRGINATILPTNEAFTPSQSHLFLAEALYQRRVPGTEWFVLVDDDTFFPFMPALVQHLRESYDSHMSWYVGGNSESFHARRLFGEQAYGGAGVFLTNAVIETVHENWERCLEYDQGWTDQIMKSCIYEHTGTKLTIDKRLHQLDLNGDPSGFYELGRQPLTIHHWKSWAKIDVVSMHRVGEICGECVLQRWQFADDFILSNGYSAAHYPLGIDFDTRKMEATMKEAPDNHDLALEYDLDLRRKQTAAEKAQYRLLVAEALDDGSVRQLYLKPGYRDEEGVKQTNDAVMELLWFR